MMLSHSPISMIFGKVSKNEEIHITDRVQLISASTPRAPTVLRIEHLEVSKTRLLSL